MLLNSSIQNGIVVEIVEDVSYYPQSFSSEPISLEKLCIAPFWNVP
jgi:hypothetical protein